MNVVSYLNAGAGMIWAAGLVGALCLSLRFPSAWLLIAAATYWFMRARGLGSQLGHREMARVDVLVTGGFLLMTGFYALACRGVALSGLVTAAAVTALFLHCHARVPARPGLLARLIIALAWAMIAYRWLNPYAFCWGCLSVG